MSAQDTIIEKGIQTLLKFSVFRYLKHFTLKALYTKKMEGGRGWGEGENCSDTPKLVLTFEEKEEEGRSTHVIYKFNTYIYAMEPGVYVYL